MHLTKCPVCRARFTGEEAIHDPCRRCSSNLGVVRTIYRLAHFHQETARYLMARGDYNSALKSARTAVELVHTDSTRHTLAVATILVDDANLPAGIYFVRIVADNKVFMQKMVVE